LRRSRPKCGETATAVHLAGRLDSIAAVARPIAAVLPITVVMLGLPWCGCPNMAADLKQLDHTASPLYLIDRELTALVERKEAAAV
jgi:hypothetical protein